MTQKYPDSSAKVLTIDFTKSSMRLMHPSGKLRDEAYILDRRPRTPEGLMLTPKQIRARARRRLASKSKRARGRPILSQQEFEALYKPVDEWDLEELARGRPRDIEGGWKGVKPKWVTREVHEKAMEAFQAAVKTGMSTHTIDALQTVQWILTNTDEDEKGRPMVPPSVKLQASTFLLEHVVGKPKQHIEQDISVKLQGILGSVMANPNEAFAPPSQGGIGGDELEDMPQYSLAHFPGQTIPIGAIGDTIQGEVVDDDSDLDSGE